MKQQQAIQYLAFDVHQATIVAKRNLWPYVGLAVVTRSSADQEIVEGRLRKAGAPLSPAV